MINCTRQIIHNYLKRQLFCLKLIIYDSSGLQTKMYNFYFAIFIPRIKFCQQDIISKRGKFLLCRDFCPNFIINN